MARLEKKPGRPRPGPAALEAAVQRARTRLLAEGAVKLSTLQPKSARQALQARLVAEGFEASASWLRRPLAEQLNEALAQGATVAKKSLASAVRGASAAELKQALVEAERAGRLRRVLRGKLETFTGADTPVLAAAQISCLRKLLSELEKALGQAVRKKGMTLLSSDVEEALGDARRMLGETQPKGAGSPSAALTLAGPPKPQLNRRSTSLRCSPHWKRRATSARACPSSRSWSPGYCPRCRWPSHKACYWRRRAVSSSSCGLKGD
jgi:hypothetical protein